jgi:hypothetical protein
VLEGWWHRALTYAKCIAIKTGTLFQLVLLVMLVLLVQLVKTNQTNTTNQTNKTVIYYVLLSLPCALRLPVVKIVHYNRPPKPLICSIPIGLHFFKKATIVPIVCRIESKTKKRKFKFLAKYIRKLKNVLAL